MFLAKSIVLAGLLVFSFSFSAHAEEATITDEQLLQKVQELMLQHPEIILDVLRQNSEAVLDIAQQGSSERRIRILKAQWKEDSTQKKDVNLNKRPFLGNKDAPVTIIAFSDFTCPYCQQASETVDRILERYGDKVNYYFKHTPLGRDGISRIASEYFVAAADQNQEKAWALYREIFSSRERLVVEGEKYLKDTAKFVGLDMKKMNAYLKTKKAQILINEDLEDAKKLGIEGTPYFLINNMIIRGALPHDLFKSAVDMALEQKSK